MHGRSIFVFFGMMQKMHWARKLNHKQIFLMLALTIVSLGLVWMAFSKYAVSPLIASAYRGESLSIFNRMISGQKSHPLAEYLSDWDRLRRSVLVGFSVLGLAVLLLFRLIVGLKSYVHAYDRREVQIKERNPWALLAFLACSGIIFTAGIVWAFGHPYPVGWDEAQYVNLAYVDIWSFKQEGIHGLLKSIIQMDPPRPPGFRLLALPITLLFGANPEILRSISLVSLGISATFVYLAAKEIAGPFAGVFAAIFFSASVSIATSSAIFGTEYVLYLAISLMLYLLFRRWNVLESSTTWWMWVGLGLALALGAWAKTSFLLIAGPIVILALLLTWNKIIIGPSPSFLIKAAGLGLALASPWWIPNYRAALELARYAQHWARGSLGSPSLATFAKWIGRFADSALGVPLFVLMLSVLLTILLKKLALRQTRLNLTQITAIWICLAGTFPLLCAQFFGGNHLMRLISPSLIPLSVTLGVATEAAQWFRARWLVIVTALVLCLQLFIVGSALTKYHFNRTADVEQWDWERLRQICQDDQIYSPLIAYLGNRTEFNPPQIQYPWIRADEPVGVRWLWRSDEGNIDWEKVTNDVNSSDIVLTAVLSPAQRAGWSLDNEYDDELARRLEANRDFSEPIRLEMGRDNPVEILVFIHEPEKVKSPDRQVTPDSRHRMWRSWDGGESFSVPVRVGILKRIRDREREQLVYRKSRGL